MNNLATLREALDARFADRYALEVGAGHSAILQIIDNAFAGMPHSQREEHVAPLLLEAGLRPTLIELYTPEEAKERGLAQTQHQPISPASWEQAVSMIEAGERPDPSPNKQRKPRRVVFYSYKGGVGRTTALIHTAFHLARAGERVVVVDMDVEAPGLHKALPRPDGTSIKAGLIDYLWERQVRPFDPLTGAGLETCLVGGTAEERTPIAYPVTDPGSRATIHLIPAGEINDDYIRRLYTLSSQEVLTTHQDAWSLLEKEIVEQLDPDIMLIDARTGLGEWGGLSLLRLADEAFLILFPSEQNGEGIAFVRNILNQLSDITTHLVLSPVPEGEIGQAIVERFLSQFDLGEEDPLKIYYTPGIASATEYPVESGMASYAPLANRILDSETEGDIEQALKGLNRLEIITSLRFPERDAKSIAADDFELFFQKTSDFNRLLDDARWVVRGRKGTGKSTLFHLFVEHQDNAIKRARGKLNGIHILPGHGPVINATLRPTTDVFEEIQRSMNAQGRDWLSLWRAYAIIRIFASNQRHLLDSVLKAKEMRPLRNHLHANFPDHSRDPWRSTHTSSLLEMLESPYSGLSRDLLLDLNKSLEEKNKKLWLLYDDLDQDLQESSPWRGDALGGLLRLAYDCNNQDLHQLRFKIFLREDIWSALVFTNKSHFGEPRTLELQWRIDDFMRLAYRLAVGGSQPFRRLAQREFPLTDQEIDSADEETLRKALAPLWGLNQEKGKKAVAANWVYARLTDARDNTYPRSLAVLLRAARSEELRMYNEKQAPSDRLLSPRAMQAGLQEASVERVNALKNEHPLLRPFLEELQNNAPLRSQFNASELKKIWNETSKAAFKTFESFVLQLDAAGLLVKKKARANYEYGIANLYIDGLGLTRVQGEKR